MLILGITGLYILEPSENKPCCLDNATGFHHKVRKLGYAPLMAAVCPGININNSGAHGQKSRNLVTVHTSRSVKNSTGMKVPDPFTSQMRQTAPAFPPTHVRVAHCLKDRGQLLIVLYPKSHHCRQLIKRFDLNYHQYPHFTDDETKVQSGDFKCQGPSKDSNPGRLAKEPVSGRLCCRASSSALKYQV